MRSLPKDQLLLLAAGVLVVGAVIAVATDHLGTALIAVALVQGIVASLVVLVLRVQHGHRAAAERRAAELKVETDAWLKGIDRSLSHLGELVVTESQATVRELRADQP